MKTDETKQNDKLMWDDDKLSGVLSALPRVDAPNDFDFRVRARIAAGKPADIPAFRLPVAVRYAVPLVLLVAVAAYFGFTRFYSFSDADVPQVSESQPVKKPVMSQPGTDGIIGSDKGSDENLNGDHAGIPSRENNNPLQRPGGDSPISARPQVPELGLGGSRDDTLGIKKSIFPRGLDPTRKLLPKPHDFENDRGIPAKEVFLVIGADVNGSNSTMTVSSVRPNSTAERAGIKTGDVIVAVNDVPVSDKTTFHGKFTGKSLRVRRDGKDIQINLKP